MNKPNKKNLSGAEALLLIQKGHMVRRACWIKGYAIRICNEKGYDAEGKVIFNETPLYTIATSGYFMHLGYTQQPFAKPHNTRDGEGLSMLFENDWEDFGFISSEDFEALSNELKDALRKKNNKLVIRV